MTRGKPRPEREWPQLWHGPAGESAWFKERMYVPLNWTRYPQINPVIETSNREIPSRETLKKALLEKGIRVTSQWSVAKMEQTLKEIS